MKRKIVIITVKFIVHKMKLSKVIPKVAFRDMFEYKITKIQNV